jgi:hypothetical protein
VEQHFKIVAILQFVMGGLAALTGFALFAIIFGAGAISGDRDAMFITSTCATVAGGFLIILSVPSLLAGWGLLKRREWARILTIVLSVLHLLHVPIGTIIGGYSLWALLQPDAKTYFA